MISFGSPIGIGFEAIFGGCPLLDLLVLGGVLLGVGDHPAMKGTRSALITEFASEGNRKQICFRFASVPLDILFREPALVVGDGDLS